MICVCPHCNNGFEHSAPQNEVKLDQVKMYDIVDLCCEHFETTRTKVFSALRGAKEIKARQVSMYLIYGEERNGLSLSDVGKFFDRDHTTVINARNRCKDALYTRMDIYRDLITLSKKADEIISREALKVAI